MDEHGDKFHMDETEVEAELLDDFQRWILKSSWIANLKEEAFVW